MSAQRTFGLAKLIEEALMRPPHKPRRYMPHVADEYGELATYAPNQNARHQNNVIEKELRRGLR